MGIYVGFLVFIFLYGFATYMLIPDQKKRKAYFLNVIFLLIYLIYSLRATSVGRDLPGYANAYDLTATIAWGDYEYIYFENGYIFLMKLFNELHFSFQGFMAVVNLIVLLPIYIAIKRYSPRPFLSVLVYVCYMFFEFNMTGIRQAIATSIILLGIMALFEGKKFSMLLYALAVALATQFHKAAFIGFFYIPFHFVKSWAAYFSAIAGVAVVFLFGRSTIMHFVKDYFEKDSMNADAGLYIGLNMMFLICLAVMCALGAHNRAIWARTQPEKVTGADMRIQGIQDKLFLLSIASLFLFGSDTSVRSYMLLNQVIIIHLPNCIHNIFNKKSEQLMLGFFCVFFVVFMFTNTLLGGGFDIVPYRFFWQ